MVVLIDIISKVISIIISISIKPVFLSRVLVLPHCSSSETSSPVTQKGSDGQKDPFQASLSRPPAFHPTFSLTRSLLCNNNLVCILQQSSLYCNLDFYMLKPCAEHYINVQDAKLWEKGAWWANLFLPWLCKSNGSWTSGGQLGYARGISGSPLSLPNSLLHAASLSFNTCWKQTTSLEKANWLEGLGAVGRTCSKHICSMWPHSAIMQLPPAEKQWSLEWEWSCLRFKHYQTPYFTRTATPPVILSFPHKKVEARVCKF